MGRYAFVLSVFAGLAMAVAPASADPVAIPNASFESPALPDASPWADPTISDWTKMPMPGYWTFGSTAWDQTSGVFVDGGGGAPPVNGIDGNQGAFLFAPPGAGFYQDLLATYEVGRSYHATMGIQGGGAVPGSDPMQLNVPAEIQLFYRDGGDNIIVIASGEYLNDNDTGVLTQLTDVTADLATVQASDPWAGQSIGIRIVATQAGFAGQQGYFDIDNVRLEAVPEPGALALLALGGTAPISSGPTPTRSTARICWASGTRPAG